MQKSLLAVITSLIFLSGGSAQTADPTLWLGMSLRTGMSKSEVLSGLASTYQLEKLPKPSPGDDSETWFVYTKGGTRTVGGYRGQLIFRGDRLTFASREWHNTTQQAAVEFSRQLVSAAIQMEKEGHVVCLLQTQNIESPDTKHRELKLRCGDKQLSVRTYSVDRGPEQASIDEALLSK